MKRKLLTITTDSQLFLVAAVVVAVVWRLVLLPLVDLAARLIVGSQ